MTDKEEITSQLKSSLLAEFRRHAHDSQLDKSKSKPRLAKLRETELKGRLEDIVDVHIASSHA